MEQRLLPPGKYLGVPVDLAVDTIGSNNTQYIGLVCEVTHELNGTTKTALDNPTHREIRLWLTGKAWEYTAAKLESIEFNGDFTAPNVSEDVKRAGIVLTCRHEDYETADGETKTNEKWDLPLGSKKERNPPKAADLIALNRKWKAKGGAAPVENPAQSDEESEPVAASNHATAAATSEGLPF